MWIYERFNTGETCRPFSVPLTTRCHDSPSKLPQKLKCGCSHPHSPCSLKRLINISNLVHVCFPAFSHQKKKYFLPSFRLLNQHIHKALFDCASRLWLELENMATRLLWFFNNFRLLCSLRHLSSEHYVWWRTYRSLVALVLAGWKNCDWIQWHQDILYRSTIVVQFFPLGDSFIAPHYPFEFLTFLNAPIQYEVPSVML